VGAVTLIGHLLWVTIAEIGRLLFGRKSAPRADASAERCGQCQWLLLSNERWCRGCGLDRLSSAAIELRALNATSDLVRTFQATGEIDESVATRLLQCVEARQNLLLHKPLASPLVSALDEVKKAAAPDGSQTLSAVERLEQLLARGPDLDARSYDDRVRALALYQELSNEQRDLLSAPGLLAGGRLLREAGRVVPALAAYRRHLQGEPDEALLIEVALEAARFAVGQERWVEAGWFLEQALAHSPPPQSRREAEELLR